MDICKMQAKMVLQNCIKVGYYKSSYVFYFMKKLLLAIGIWSFIVFLLFFGSHKIIQHPPDASLKTVITKARSGASGTYSVVVKNLKTGEFYSLNDKKVYEAGSLYKLWIMAETFVQIQNGIIKEDEILSQDIATLNTEFDIASEGAELTEGMITLSVYDALNQMITISHNYAALLLTEKIKLSSVKTFLEKNGFSASTIAVEGQPPATTAFDIALFFEKLFKGQLANKKYTDVMIDYLKHQERNDKLPKYLPKNTVVTHKTGEIDFLSHDAGIVYAPKGDYIIVVLSDSDYPQGAEERIAQISKAVYDYFVKQEKK